jgi:hypothetical protein
MTKSKQLKEPQSGSFWCVVGWTREAGFNASVYSEPFSNLAAARLAMKHMNLVHPECKWDLIIIWTAGLLFSIMVCGIVLNFIGYAQNCAALPKQGRRMGGCPMICDQDSQATKADLHIAGQRLTYEIVCACNASMLCTSLATMGLVAVFSLLRLIG